MNFPTDFFKSLNSNIYERKNVQDMAESKNENSFQTQERKLSSISMIFIKVFYFTSFSSSLYVHTKRELIR